MFLFWCFFPAECEKERLRAESERKKAEEEKALRLQIEKEGLSVKEQLARVLQRLDAVERNSKSDRLETDRIRGEVIHLLEIYLRIAVYLVLLCLIISAPMSSALFNG